MKYDQQYFKEYIFLYYRIGFIMRNSYLFLLVLLLLQISCKKGGYVRKKPDPVITNFSPEKGVYNDMVSIKGAHFDSSIAKTSVSFNGVVAILQTVSDTLIIARVPQNASTGKIGVSVDGRSATSTNDFVVITNGKWTKRAEKKEISRFLGRAAGMGFSIGDKGFLFGGAIPDKTENDFWEYNPSSNNWTEKPNPGFYLEFGISMVINNKAYVGIGSYRVAGIRKLSNELWEYDPAENKWTKKADFPGTPRHAGFGLGIGNKGYAGLGYTTSGEATNDWWEYDPALDKWTRKKDNPDGTANLLVSSAGFTVNGKLYVGTGQIGFNKNWWEYNPANDIWVKKAPYPGKPISGPSGFAIGSKGYVAGGGEECWEYDAGTNTWAQKSFFESRVFGGAFSIGNKGYYTSGSTGVFQKDIWEFDPDR